MTKSNFTSIVFFIPSISKKKLKGKLIWSESDFITLEFENTLKQKLPFSPLEVIYATTLFNQKLTIVGCFPSHSVDNHYVYTINEIHEDEWIKTTPTSLYKEIYVEITFLTTWYKSIIEFGELQKDSRFHSQINILKNITSTYILNKKIAVELQAYSSSSFKDKTITLKTKSNVKITSQKRVSRNSLFSYSLSFLNLFSLFVREKPYIDQIVLKKINGESQKVLMNFKKHDHESEITKILLFHKEIESQFLEILKAYFKSRAKYDEIINRLRTLSLGNIEESFLSLCRCLEIYHKSFIQHQNDTTLIKKYVKEFSDNGIKTTHKKDEWNQLLRYLHLYDISNQYPIFQFAKTTHHDFLNTLKNSRNYYTHPIQTNDHILTSDELKRINIQLRTWVRILILQKLSLPKNLIDMVRRKEKGNYLFLNHETNPFSIFYKPTKK
jgi:ApeA N-terminal domain 1